TAVDIKGSLAGPSTTGKKYILTVVDYATRYPDTIPLANTHADTIADALQWVFTQVGYPKEILSDQGSQFTAELTQQLWCLCGIKALHSALYHPQTNGLCERFNETLKQLLRAFTQDRKDWEKYLPHLLFAYREVPQESTEFSPFELLYGCRVRGPLDLVRAHWEGSDDQEGLPVLSYVLELREHLRELTDLVQVNMQEAQTQQKAWYDQSTRSRSLVGQKVLVLKPQRQNKMQAAWQGPYQVVDRLGDNTYVVVSCADTRVRQTFHVNMIKAYMNGLRLWLPYVLPLLRKQNLFPCYSFPEHIIPMGGGRRPVRGGFWVPGKGTSQEGTPGQTGEVFNHPGVHSYGSTQGGNPRAETLKVTHLQTPRGRTGRDAG
uniref:Integrase catalytic domain-containing protein n=1 Tax=Leptobrachium leishanense TaxID=445787 RepID=A0A8C5MZC9_9ANUR